MPTMEPDLAARLRRLADLLPVLETSTEADFGVWVKSTQREPGVWTMPYVDYGPTARAFHVASGSWVRPDVDWMSWAQTDEARELERDRPRIAAATPEQIARIVTTVVRGDRFNEGNMLHAFTTGVLTAIARRAKALAEDPAALAAAVAADERRSAGSGTQATVAEPPVLDD